MDVKDFEKLWTEVASEICQAMYVKPEVQEIKNSLQKNGFLTMEGKSTFIDIFDKTKHEIIYKKFGDPGSEGYKKFSKSWQNWFANKGVKSKETRKQQSSVDHVIFGSTPDPVQFLLNFEGEIMGTLQDKHREQF